MKSKFDLHAFMLDALKAPTKRDKQVKVGPSDLGSMCTRCLADALIRSERTGFERWWLGAVIGTAIHNLVNWRLKLNPAVKSEFKVKIGTLPEYGLIGGTLDLYIKSEAMVVDFKSTTRKKLAMYKRLLDNSDTSLSLASERFKFNGYLNQLMLYGLGLHNAGVEVKTVAVVFICRDGTGDNDIWEWPAPFDLERAQQVWARAEALWGWLQQPERDLNTLPSATGCFYCETMRGNDTNE